MSKYKTIQSASESLFKDKHSKFYGYAFPVSSIEEVKQQLLSIKKEHHQARHFCFAYRIGLDGNNFRTNDDGEPSGTAGKPILGQIDSLDLTNVCIVVVRYFGGTKLGVPGLINAYRSSAKMALEAASIIDKELTVKYAIKCEYSNVSILMDLLKNNQVEIAEKKFDATPTLIIILPVSTRETIINKIKDLRTCVIKEIEI